MCYKRANLVLSRECVYFEGKKARVLKDVIHSLFLSRFFTTLSNSYIFFSLFSLYFSFLSEISVFYLFFFFLLPCLLTLYLHFTFGYLFPLPAILSFFLSFFLSINPCKELVGHIMGKRKNETNIDK